MSGPRDVPPYLATSGRFEERTGDGMWDDGHSDAVELS